MIAVKARKALHYGTLACNWKVKDGCIMMEATGEETRSVVCKNRGKGIFIGWQPVFMRCNVLLEC